MKYRTIGGLVLLLLIIAGTIIYFIPVAISLTPEKQTVIEDREVLTVTVANINIFKIPISKGLVESTSIEPEDLAIAKKGDKNGIVDVIFLKDGNGKLIVKSDRYTGVLPLSSTASASIKPKDTKPKSRLRMLYEKHKHVEKIFLRDGMIMYGVMFEKGSRINFITPDGTLKLSRDDIVRVVYLKPDNL